MNEMEHTETFKVSNLRTVAGILLLLAGGVLFLDSFLKTGWLPLLILPAVGSFLYVMGVRRRHAGLIITGSLVAGIGLGGMMAWGPAIRFDSGEAGLPILPHLLIKQIGYLMLFTAGGWALTVITTFRVTRYKAWWALVPGGVMGSLGFVLLLTSLRWLDFVFFISVGTGLGLLLWGTISRLLGLIIPGCLLLGIGPGIYMGWRTPAVGNTLVQTGIMLVVFAFGWGIISLFSRWVTGRSIWWPMIPGGILAMVGAGLYIGGDPTRALGFIGNTGSIALMIFGLYLLLMRKGIHH